MCENGLILVLDGRVATHTRRVNNNTEIERERERKREIAPKAFRIDLNENKKSVEEVNTLAFHQFSV